MPKRNLFNPPWIISIKIHVSKQMHGTCLPLTPRNEVAACGASVHYVQPATSFRGDKGDHVHLFDRYFSKCWTEKILTRVFHEGVDRCFSKCCHVFFKFVIVMNFFGLYLSVLMKFIIWWTKKLCHVFKNLCRYLKKSLYMFVKVVWFTRGFLAWYWGAHVRPWSLNLLFCRSGFGLVVSVVVPLMLEVFPYARGRGFNSQSRLLCKSCGIFLEML
jgi:hypothetical protein